VGRLGDPLPAEQDDLGCVTCVCAILLPRPMLDRVGTVPQEPTGERMRTRFAILTGVALSAVVLGATASAADDDRPIRVSGPTPFAPGCGGTSSATLYTNAEVQPHIAVNPRNPRHLVGVYQQDRWSDVASRGLVTQASFDGGQTRFSARPQVSTCAGGTTANGGDFERVTDSWASIAPDGTAYMASLSLTGGILAPGSQHGVLVSRSANGGKTWGEPTTLVREDGRAFNDLPSITADPTDARYVYAVWDRLALVDGGPHFVGPTYLSRSTDNGRTWEPPRPIFDPGLDRQTLANQIAVLPDGTLVNVFLHYKEDVDAGTATTEAAVIRSTDKGRTWSPPVKVGDMLAVGARDPQTQTPIRDGALIPHIAVGSGGAVYVAWQDARFTGGERDGVVLSRSTDGGRTWSDAVRVNADPTVQAFSPALATAPDGKVGVTYYDLRSNTADPATLPTDYRLASSADGGRTWAETRVSGPFDLATAPRVGAASSMYLGDFHGLVAAGPHFVPLFPMAGGDPNNRSDIFAAQVIPPASGFAVRPAAAPRMTPRFRQRVQANAARVPAAQLIRD
jgi:hypothetical protein